MPPHDYESEDNDERAAYQADDTPIDGRARVRVCKASIVKETGWQDRKPARANATHGKLGELFVYGISWSSNFERADHHDQRCDERRGFHAIVMLLFK
jgi:hypothetical protein